MGVFALYDELIEEMRGQDSEHPGLLVALWPPADIAAQLAVSGGEAQEDLHLTLAYCPSAAPDQVELARLIVSLDEFARIMPPLEAKIGGLGVFWNCGGQTEGKHVLYASVDSPKLDAIRRAVCRSLADLGLKKSEEHGYTPHITLEYVPTEADLEDSGIADKERVESLFNRTGEMEFKFERLVIAQGDDRLEIPLRGDEIQYPVGGLYEAAVPTAGKISLVEDSELLEAAQGGDGSKWRVLLIKAGTSKNRVHYSEEVLRKAAPLFEGTRAYADHPGRDEQRNRPERSVRDIVGWYDNVRWDPEHRGLTADFNVVSSASWLREGLRDAWDRGKKDLYGFSINAGGSKSARLVEGGVYLEAISVVNSTDVVTTPGAGGAVLDMLESTNELSEALAAFRTSILEEVGELVEAWKTKGKTLTSEHRAKISAALKARGGTKKGSGKGPATGKKNPAPGGYERWQAAKKRKDKAVFGKPPAGDAVRKWRGWLG